MPSGGLTGIHLIRSGSVRTEKLTAHRIAVGRDIALAEHDLEQMRLFMWRTKQLGASNEISAPYSPKPLVKFHWIKRVNLRPAPIEALGPDIERESIVAAQILDVDHLQPIGLHGDNDVRQAGNPAAGKYMLHG